MAAQPPATNDSNDTILNAATPPAKPTTLAASLGYRTGTPPKYQRGHNKPKCKQCGDVACSRCPFESCKSCCSRNQNPCHIHGMQIASLRQLSNSFSKFNNLHVSLRSRKPLTRKIHAKCSFAGRSFNCGVPGRQCILCIGVKSYFDGEQWDDDHLVEIASNSTRSDSVRNRTRQTVDEGLKKLQKRAVKADVEEPNEASKRPKILRTERLADVSELLIKLIKLGARRT